MQLELVFSAIVALNLISTFREVQQQHEMKHNRYFGKVILHTTKKWPTLRIISNSCEL